MAVTYNNEFMKFLFPKKKDKVTATDKVRVSGKENSCTVHAISETGPVRDHNEDSVAYTFPKNNAQNMIAVVADGMGGHNAGEVASKMACDLLLKHCMENWDRTPPQTLLEQALLGTHSEIMASGKTETEHEGMGTTATAVIIQKNICYIGHIGDSRAYMQREGILKQLSTDHTLVNQMFQNGEISEKERDSHPMKNVLLQALGTTPTIQPQVSTQGWDLMEGDRLFLCSDGVYDVLSKKDINDLLMMKQPEFVLECLASIVTERHVSDNFTALLIDIVSGSSSIPSKTKEQNAVL